MCTFTVGALVRHVHIHCGGISKACAHSLWGALVRHVHTVGALVRHVHTVGH